MKIHTYGNVLNNSYNLTRFLRAKGIDAEMFLDDTSLSGQDYPWWEDADVTADALPPWIHYHPVTRADVLRNSAPFRGMVSAFRNCDAALTCSWGPILSAAADVPSFFYSYGGDLVVAHTAKALRDGARRMVAGYRPGIRDVLLGRLQRRALDHVSRIGVSNAYQIENYVRPLGLLPKMVRTRLAWDLDAYAPQPSPELAARYEAYDMVFFMLTRHVWCSVWNDIKGNDKFIRAFAAFVRSGSRPTKLIMVEKGQDVDASKALVRALGIERHVDWISEQNKDGMRRYYSIPNVVIVDQFWHDDWKRCYPGDAPLPRMSFGSGSIEALAARRPLISAFFDHEIYDGESPPILTAFTVPEILERLHECAAIGPEGLRDYGERGHAFVRRHHDWRVTTDLYISHLRDIAQQ